MPAPDTFLDLYQRYAEEVTDACPDYHNFMGFVTLASVIGNRVFMPWGDTNLFPNLWVILVGKSTWDRKTTSINISKRLLFRFNNGRLIYPNEFSYEKLVIKLADSPAGCFYFSEVKTFAGLLSRDYMLGARGLLADLYDGPDFYTRELSGREYKIERPAFSIAAATTTTWLIENLKPDDIEAGFLPRFLIVPAGRRIQDKPRPPMADDTKRTAMLTLLREIENITGACYLTEKAGKLHDEWYRKMRMKVEGSGGRFSPFAGRLQGYLIKVAMLLEINNTRSLKVSDTTMSESIKMVDWLYSHMSAIERDEIPFNGHDKDLQKVKRALRGAGGKMARRDLIRATHLSSRALDGALQTLKDSEEIGQDSAPGEGRKPVTIYVLKS